MSSIPVVIGKGECSIEKVVSKLKSSSSSSLLLEKWTAIAIDLETSVEKIKTWKADIRLDKSQLIEVLLFLVADWVSRKGKAATVQEFMRILNANELKECADSLKDLLPKDTTKPFKKYSRLPSKAQNFLEAPNKKHCICIIPSLDIHITCEKLTENVDDCVFKEFDENVKLTSADKKGANQFLTVTSIKDLKLILNTILGKKVKQAPKLVVVTDIQFENELPNLLKKHSSWKKAVQINQDRMEFDALTSSYQLQIRENLRKVLKIDFEDENLNRMLNGQLLADLINEKEINLFRNTLPNELSYYISRTLLKRDSISAKVFEEKCPDIFLFSGIERYELSQFVKNEVTDSSTKQIRKKEIATRYLTLDDEDHFEMICSKTSEPVHWLVHEKGKFKWRRSSGKMDILRKHLEDIQDHVTEDDFFTNFSQSERNQPICISDGPGIGKTVFLSNIGNRLAKELPDRIVIFVPVNELIKQITQTRINDEIKRIEEALKSIACENLLGREILEASLRSEKSVMIELLLDGFDEINGNDLMSATNALEKIRKSFKSVRLWVTTRPHLVPYLENALGTFGLQIEGFTPANQLNFLTSYWSQTRKELNGQKLSRFAGSCLETLRFGMKTVQHEIAGIPLQCLILAEIHEKEANDYANPTSSTTHLGVINNLESITNLYQLSIEQKFEKYRSAYGKVKLTDKKLADMHVLVSVALLFPTYVQKLNTFLLKPDELQEVWKVGILESSSDTVDMGIKFVHHTFAEYFVAQFVLEALTKPKSFWDKIRRKGPSTFFSTKSDLHDFIFNGVLACLPISIPDVDRLRYFKVDSFQFQYGAITYFINSLIPNHIQGMSNHHFPLLNPKVSADTVKQIIKACAEQNLTNVFDFLKRVHFIDQLDSDQKVLDDLVYLTIQKSEVTFVEMLMNHFSGRLDSEVEMKALHEAVYRGDFSIIEYLVNKRKLRSVVKKLQPDNTFLHECVINSAFGSPTKIEQRTQVIGFLVGINRNMLGFKDNEGKTPLLSSNVHVDLLIKLIQLGANACAQDKYKNNVLHTSHHLSQENFHRLILIIEDVHLKKIISLKGPKTGTPLLKAFVSVDANITAEPMVTFGAHAATANSYGDAILANIISLDKGKLTVRKLLECGGDINWLSKNGETLLHIAAEWGRLDAVKFLIKEYNLEMNALNKNGLTPMDYVLQSTNTFGDRYATGVELNKLGGIFKKVINLEGRSWLHVAAGNENIQSIKLLLHLKMDVNRKDENWNTPLHFVMNFQKHKFKYFYVTKLLLNNNADPNNRNKNGETPFHLAIRNKHINFATFALLKSLTDVKWTPALASQALDYAISTSQYMPDDELYSLLEELEGHGADFSYRNDADEDKNSLLHNAVKSNHFRAVQFLVEKKGENVNLRNARQETPLLATAIHTGNWEIMKYLIDHGADVYATEEKGCNFLHFYFVTYLPSPLQLHSLVEYLVDKGYSKLIHTPEETDGTTPLQLALCCLKPEEKTLALLHFVNANFNHLNNRGYNSLSFAVEGKQSPKLLETLINRYGVNPKQLTSENHNLLHLAAIHGTEEVLKFCIDLNIFSVNEKDNNTALHLSLHWHGGQVDVLEKCKLLVKNGADVNSVDLKKLTPIHVAASNKDNFISFEAIKYLIENGGDMLAVDINNCNFLHFYFGNNRKISPSEFHNRVEYLVRKRCCHLFNNMSKDEQHKTPLQLAIKLVEPFETTLALLQSQGVNFNIVDGLGRSLLMYAAAGRRSTHFMTCLINQFGLEWKKLCKKKGNLLHYSALGGSVDSLEFILELGELNINQVSDEGDTPLHFAVKTDQTEDVLEICQLLIDNGADGSKANNQGRTPLDVVLEKFEEGDVRDELTKVLQYK